MRNIWNNHSLGIVLFLMFLFSWGMQYLTATGNLLSSDFWNATFENWESEFLQVGVFVVITKYLIYKGSPQSKDGDDEIKSDIKEIKQHLGIDK